MSERLADDDRRDTTRSGQVRSWAWKYAWQLIFGGLVIVGLSLFNIAKGLYAAPGQLAKLIPAVAAIEAEQAVMKREAADASVALWSLVTFECLKLPQGDSLFVKTRLNCGKAYEKSGFNGFIRR